MKESNWSNGAMAFVTKHQKVAFPKTVWYSSGVRPNTKSAPFSKFCNSLDLSFFNCNMRITALTSQECSEE
jgi:hypothetical protein